MKNILKIMLLCGLITSVFACTKDFEDINANPNAAESVNAAYYMTKVITLTAFQYSNDAWGGNIANATRYTTKLTNAEADGFNWSAASWDSYYYALSVNKSFYDEASKEGAEQYMAVSEIMDVFIYDYVTSLWGDCPYTEAVRAKDDIIYPAYDKQETIYPDLLERLEAANETLANTSKSIDSTNDVMFGGDILKWRKFANSLRLRMLLKESKAVPAAFDEIVSIAGNSSKYPIFASNDDNAELPYNSDNMFPGGPTVGGAITDQFKEFIKRRPSKEVIDNMLERDDPRIAALYDKVEDPASCTVDFNEYVGVPIALKTPYTYNGGTSGTSKVISTYSKEKFYQDYGDYLYASLMIYPEVCFILAEAAQKKGANVGGKSAQTHYENGIKASMAYWGVDDATAISTYIAGTKVAYDGTQKIILEQKWLALILKGPEAWFDYRRTDDAIGLNDKLVSDNLKQDYIPYRYIYPDNERSYNRAKYEEAIKVFGEDNINTKMWLVK